MSEIRTCPHCESHVPEQDETCPNCGASLGQTPAHAPAPASENPYAAPRETGTLESAARPPKSPWRWLRVVAGCLWFVVFGYLAVLMIAGFSQVVRHSPPLDADPMSHIMSFLVFAMALTAPPGIAGYLFIRDHWKAGLLVSAGYFVLIVLFCGLIGFIGRF